VARSALGTLEGIGGGGYGDIQVRVAVAGGKLAHVSIAKLDVTSGTSQEIEQQAVPMLLQQTSAAGGAQIDGVSGATYTTQAYEASLQSAIDRASN
jgi:uncharacterized protein with FMN-binding domain